MAIVSIIVAVAAALRCILTQVISPHAGARRRVLFTKATLNELPITRVHFLTLG
jgi:hypothetical protein